MIGESISHYRILEKLGEGGMGVVYKAQDTKLDRPVALKFLPGHLSGSEQDKARFIQEAKAAATLNHPNICTIHAIEEHDGRIFIAMEFVEGQTLRERAPVGTSHESPVPMKQAIEIGIQLADGLAAAHEKGVVHRDLKPENIMIQKDGRVRIMDFGLAKLKGASRLTKAGSTVGTIGYMSPEQVQGMEADHRSDIFSLGVILYEMFSGQSPFKGVHETAIMYEIVNVDPSPISTIKSGFNPELDVVVFDCFAKDPGERCQSAAEVARNLRRLKRESSKARLSRIMTRADAFPLGAQIPGTELPLGEASSGLAGIWMKVKRGGVWMFIAIVFFLGMLALLVIRSPGAREIEFRTSRFYVLPPEKATIGSAPMISPDGQRIAFVATDSLGKTLLWIRPLDQLNAQPLTSTDDASYPFWSADSRFVGFFSRSKLKKIDASGGPVETLSDAPNARGGTWNRDGLIIFAPTSGGALFKVSAAGGAASQLTSLDSTRQEVNHRWPYFLPDGRHYLYFVTSGLEEKQGVYSGTLESNQSKQLIRNTTLTMYAPSQTGNGGYLFFAKEGALMAQRFDDQGLETLGDAFPVADGVVSSLTFRTADFSISLNGTIAFRSGATMSNHLVWFDRSGKQLGSIPAQVSFQYPGFSSDGKRLVAAGIDQSGVPNIWLVDLTRGIISTRFTFIPTTLPIWSPDGSKIVYTTQSGGAEVLYQKISSGAGKDEELYRSLDVHKHPTDWSRDGKYIIYDNFSTQYDLYILPLTGDRKPFPYLQTSFEERHGQFSPDAKWVAYASNERGGNFEIFVQPFPVTGAKYQISRDGGIMPRWRRDGRELFYIAADRKLMAVPVRTSPSFEAGLPAPLFEARSFTLSTNVGIEYAVTNDGQRFLVNLPLSAVLSAPMTVVLNWEAGVKKK